MSEEKDIGQLSQSDLDRREIIRYAEDVVDDPSINKQPLEVYLYYAAIERAREAADTRPIPDGPWNVLFKRLTGRKGRIIRPPNVVQDSKSSSRQGRLGTLIQRVTRRNNQPVDDTNGPTVPTDEKNTITTIRTAGTASPPDSADPSDGGGMAVLSSRERESAYRLLRVSSWQVVFFLIMTDVLGWYTAPMAFAQLGYGPGVLVYTFFYLLAFGSGQILWRMYLNMDSERYPVKCYADLGERTYGPVVKHLFNVLQSLQLVFNVAMLIIMEGQGLAEIIDFKFCYIAINVFFAILGAALSQIKTIRGLGVFTCVNFVINLVVMATTMAGVSMFDPVPAQSNHKDLSEPMIHSGWVPSYSKGWYQQVSGAQLAVFAYGGAMVFVEFMAEMRRPRDFWKSALGAQFLCYALYMIFGLFVYSKQGQYTNILPTVNIDDRTFQGITNILGLVCVTIIAVMYSHFGCKVVYRNIMRGYFHAPSLTSAKSTLLWSATVCVYWAVAWAIGSAIPNITDLNTVVGATCILQFTYTFPSALLLGHWVQLDAIRGDEPWQPGVEPWSNRVDSWRDISRWKRGFKRYWYVKAVLVCIVLGALSLCGLGIYSGVESAKESFGKGFTIAYSCRAPGQPQD